MTRKPKPNRTIGPLHFEDLEPHRFEDLVRQLIYDFRAWAQLEATGRSGSDDGFDVRGFETIVDREISSLSDEEDDTEPPPEHRLWLIQCKREKSITPKKLRGFLDDLAPGDANPLDGLIFAAACDFSKQARDVFREKAREFGLAEAHLWGKGEIEDMLFQPKNDNLLFAYFGISLQVRRRSLRTDVRARLATKRKAMKCVEDQLTPVLIRDASDDRYPYLEGDDTRDRFERGRWKVFLPHRCQHDGIYILRKRCFAFIDEDGVAWDYAETMNDADPHDDPWRSEAEEQIIRKRSSARSEAMAIWDKFDAKNKAWFEVFLVLPYERILAIDEHGDEFFEHAHIYTEPFNDSDGPFLSDLRFKLESIRSWDDRDCYPDLDKRVNVFPRRSS